MTPEAGTPPGAAPKPAAAFRDATAVVPSGTGDIAVTTAVFQVLAADGGVAGAGFLAGDGIAFTCAHVVSLAGQHGGGQVELVFARLPGAPRTTARVLAEGWRATEDEDIAVLRLEGAPSGARPLSLGASAGCRGHRVLSYGFPGQAPRGGHFGYGTAGGLLAEGGGAGRLLQLSAANDLTTGFSGGPVVDEVTGLVIGMVTSIASPDTHHRGLGIAYATPAEVLRETRPELAVSQVCPYLGLQPFTAQHAAWFHGREAAVESVLAALGGHRRMLMLLGPSGAGKSSLVKAGVLPALAEGAVPGSDRWLPVLARPGRNLLAELERAGLPGASADGVLAASEARLAAEPGHDRVLLVIDQFEELLTQSAPGTADPAADRRVRAAEQLVELTDSHAPVTVVLIMRNDFYAALDALSPALLNAAMPGILNVPTTLGVPELRAIITRPAEAVGLPLENGLVDRIISDVMQAHSAVRHVPVTLLPPLELALRELWVRRNGDDGRLTHEAYGRIGTVIGSMTVWCDTALGQLCAGHRPIARRILTALVRPADEPDGIPATRQAVPLARLRALAGDQRLDAAAADEAFDTVLTALVRHRLITVGTAAPWGTNPGAAVADEATAELVHDALVREWADLRDWVAQDHRFQLWLQRAAEQQTRHARSGLAGDLLDGTLLAEGLDWAGRRSLPAEITGILEASRRHQQTAVRRARRINSVLAGLLALALTAVGAALYQQHTATAAQHEARSRRLAAQSAALRGDDPDLSSLLAVMAWRTAHTNEAAGALFAAPAADLRARLAGHHGPPPSGLVGSMAFSPDGSTLVTADDTTVRRWDTKTGGRRATPDNHQDMSGDTTLSTDGTTLAVPGESTVQLVDVRTGGSRILPAGHRSHADSALFGPDGRMLATVDDTTVRVWDLRTGEALASLTTHADFLTTDSIAFSPDGATLAVPGDKNRSVRLLDISTGRSRTVVGELEHAVLAVAFHPGGRALAVLGDEETAVPLLALDTGKPIRTFTGRDDMVSSLAFSPDGTTMAFGTRAGTVRLWDVRSGQSRGGFTGHEGAVHSMVFSPDGSTLAAADEGTVRLWDARIGQTYATFGAEQIAPAVAFSPDGSTLASVESHGTLRLRDLATGAARTVLMDRRVAHYAMAYSPDGRTLATADDEAKSVQLRDPRTGRTRTTVPGRDDGVSEVAFSPDGRTLATVGDSRDATVRLWDTRSGGLRATLPRDERIRGAVSFSPDRRTIAFAGGWKHVRLWDMESGSTRVTLKGHRGYVTATAFSPDGRMVASGSRDGTARLWDAETGELLTTLTGQGDWVSSVVFSPDGRTLATASDNRDATVRLWDTRSGRLRATLSGHYGPVYAVAFHPDGKILATSGRDGSVRLWDVDLPGAQEISDAVCTGLHRDLTETERVAYLGSRDGDPVCPDTPGR
ncbi:trypsin-like peptidase domain-containing protein [Streptomyces sp. NPDC059168]|uniref:nSTAND1 domain-containing NTPase n=1 Tax=Streptomyces sp. NPDC059168 TaxID=3346753 RepID=UPI003699D75A